jgi:hypothetical protein
MGIFSLKTCGLEQFHWGFKHAQTKERGPPSAPEEVFFNMNVKVTYSTQKEINPIKGKLSKKKGKQYRVRFEVSPFFYSYLF